MSETLKSSLLIFVLPFIALSRGVDSIIPSFKPTIKFVLFSNKKSTAYTPILLAKTLSKHDGEPPLCKCPKTDTLAS